MLFDLKIKMPDMGIGPYFASALTALNAIALIIVFAPWIVYTVLIVITVGMTAIGCQVWFELTRIKRVKGKGTREVP